MWSKLTVIHEVLERDISVLLESDIVLEGLLNHFVHLRFEFQKLLSELNGIL
jgi:hypothetical protein